MKYFLPLFILSITSCSGQQSAEQQSKIDTAKLFNPNPQTDEIGASEVNIFKRNIVLTKPDYYIVFNEKEHKLETLGKVKEFIKANGEQIQKNKFYIITDSGTSFKKTATIIKILTENQITNYKVINYLQYFSPVEPVAVQDHGPRETFTRISDSAYFSIAILENEIIVKLKGKESRLKNTDDLDQFIVEHKQDIKEISIRMDKNTPYSKFDTIIEILKKHELRKISLVAK
jgi:biopolymer transport protein ExbD